MASRFVSILNLPARAWLLGSAAAFVLPANHPVFANQPPVLAAETGGRQTFKSAKLAYDIPAGTLEAALQKWSDLSNLEVLAATHQVKGVKTEALSGAFTPEQALKKLLIASTLKYELTSPNSIAVYDPASAHGARAQATTTTLPTITVRSPRTRPAPRPVAPAPAPPVANPNSTMTLPPAYAGGQVASGGQVGILGNRDVMNTPFNQTSYTSELIQNQQVKFIADVLQNDPSVIVDTGPSGGADNFIIRGFDVGNGDILFNGMPGIAPTWFNSMMSESIERVEVLKGPNALLNGAGALGSVGGAINLVPKRAGDKPLTLFTPDFAMDSQFGGHVDVGRRFGANKEWGVRINGVYRNGDTPIDHQSRESRLAAFGLDYRGERVRLSADLGYQYQDLKGVRVWSSVNPGVPVPGAPNTRTNASPPWGYVAPEVFYGVAKGEFDLTSNITAFAAIGGNQRKQPSMYLIRNITDAAGTLAATTAFESADAMYTVSTEVGVRGNFQTGPIKHQATIAYNRLNIDWRTLDGRTVAVPASNIYNPIHAPSPAGGRPDADDAQTQRDITLSGTIIADTLSILDERVQMTAGVRLQQIEVTRFNLPSGTVRSYYNEGAATPMVGLVVKPLSNVSLYGNYIQGLQQGPIAPLGTANQGEVFPPFMTEQYEAGVKVDFGRITTTLAAYQIALPSGYTDPTTNLFGVNGEQRHQGIEFNVFGELTNTLRLLGGATYIDSVLLNTLGGLNDGHRGAGVPEYRFVAGAEWDTPFLKALTLTGRIVYNGAQFIDQANLQEISGWTRVDVGARYRIERANGKPVTIRANLENVFDTKAWIGSTYGGITPNDPRTFKLSSTFEF
jgi:iron complex outermembrane recepter protein